MTTFQWTLGYLHIGINCYFVRENWIPRYCSWLTQKPSVAIRESREYKLEHLLMQYSALLLADSVCNLDFITILSITIHESIFYSFYFLFIFNWFLLRWSSVSVNFIYCLSFFIFLDVNIVNSARKSAPAEESVKSWTKLHVHSRVQSLNNINKWIPPRIVNISKFI